MLIYANPRLFEMIVIKVIKNDINDDKTKSNYKFKQDL
jgi:hypothetical protein